MKRWIRTAAVCACLVGGVLPAAAYAHDAQEHGDHEHGRRGGLVGAALELDSLTADQRSSIEQLVAQRKAASGPVRQADAQVLTMLAQQVEQAKIDPQGLAPSLGAEQSAATAEASADRDALNRLHTILTPAQRTALVDRIEAAGARHAHPGDGGKAADPENGARFEHKIGRGLDLTAEQRAAVLANLKAERPADAGESRKGERHKLLEAFRADSFDAAPFVEVRHPGEHMEKLAAAMVPVLTPSQRATLASHLRARASHTPKSG